MSSGTQSLALCVDSVKGFRFIMTCPNVSALFSQKISQNIVSNTPRAEQAVRPSRFAASFSRKHAPTSRLIRQPGRLLLWTQEFAEEVSHPCHQRQWASAWPINLLQQCAGLRPVWRLTAPEMSSSSAGQTG